MLFCASVPAVTPSSVRLCCSAASRRLEERRLLAHLVRVLHPRDEVVGQLADGERLDADLVGEFDRTGEDGLAGQLRRPAGSCGVLLGHEFSDLG